LEKRTSYDETGNNRQIKQELTAEKEAQAYCNANLEHTKSLRISRYQ
jgi:hypothetical protein